MTRPEGKFTFALFAALIESEREVIRERTQTGMAVAKRRSRHVGRPPKLTPDRLAHARELIKGGRQRADVAAPLGVGTATLRQALNG